MGKGLLAWWRRRIVARGLAGAALFAVPVAVAALIGFGASLSGVAGGISSFTNGPDAVPASAQTGPSKLNRALVALASSRSRGTGQSNGGSGGNLGGGTNGTGTGTGTSSGGSTGGGSGSSGSGSSLLQTPTISTPSAPSVSLPGSSSGTGDTIGGAVNNVLGGVGNTVNGVLGN